MEIIYDEKQQKWRFIVSEFSPIGYLIDKALPATCELPFEIRGRHTITEWNNFCLLLWIKIDHISIPLPRLQGEKHP